MVRDKKDKRELANQAKRPVPNVSTKIIITVVGERIT